MRALLRTLWLAATTASACGGASEPAARVLRFTAIPDSDRTELEQRFRPVADYLAERLDLAVEYVPTSDYSASVEMFKNGDVHLAWFGGLTGVQARAAVDGARAIAQGAVDPRFRSYFIAHDLEPAEPGATGGDSTAAPFPTEALRGARFAFGSRQSTSGRLMPEYFLRRETGLAPDQLFGEVSFSGSHDQTAELVNRGAVDAGAINFRTYETLRSAGAIDAATCRVVWTTPEYADYNWTVHPDVDERFGAGTSDAIRDALVELDDPALLEALQRPEGLIPASNDEFEGIAEVARALGFLRAGG